MSDVPVMNKSTKNEQFIAHATTENSFGNLKAQARAGLADVASDDTRTIRGHGRILTVGADAQLDKKYVGVGVEATLLETEADFGNVGGIKFGISADSGVGIGTEGLCAKVLGTGVKLDKSGSEVTLFGTGVKLGSWSNPYGWFAK